MRHGTSPGSSMLVSDGSHLIGFFGVGFFFPSHTFQLKKLKPFMPLNTSCTPLQSRRSISASIFSHLLCHHLLPELCFFSYWVRVANQPSKAPQTHLTNTVRVVVAGGAGQSDPDDSTNTQASMKITWTLCESSGEAFLTRGLAKAAPCCTPAPAACRCTLEACGGGEAEAQTYPTFPNTEEGWCETAHHSRPTGKQGSVVSLHRLHCRSSLLLSPCRVPDKHQG